MAEATIVFMDVAKFSEKSTLEQKELVESFSELIVQLIRPLVPGGDIAAASNVILLPTGDGAAIVFFKDVDNEIGLTTILLIVHRLQLWAKEQTNVVDGRLVSLRIGLNHGAVTRITDVNGRSNVCGKTVNFAQRIMDAVDPGQIGVSSEFHAHYFGSDRNKIELAESDRIAVFSLGDEIEVTVKHGRIVLLRVAGFDDVESVHMGHPSSYGKMVVSLTQLPKTIEGGFKSNLMDARSIALVQLTGENLLDLLEAEECIRPDMECLWVFMPSEDVARHHDFSMHLKNKEQSQGQVIDRWKAYLSRLSRERPGADVRLGLFDEIPYFGGSFLDWRARHGIIHISPYVWGVQAKNCPGYDLVWQGEKEPEVYATYRKGLNYLASITSNALVSLRE